MKTTDPHHVGRSKALFSTALAFASVHWAFLALIQCENFAFCLKAEDQGLSDLKSFVSAFPFIQTQNIIFTFGVAVAAWLLLRWFVSRIGFFMIYATLTLYLVLDQVYYKLFFDHFRPSSSERAVSMSPSMVISSLRHEMDGVFWFNIVAAVVMVGGLGWKYIFRKKSAPIRTVEAGGVDSPVKVTRGTPIGAMRYAAIGLAVVLLLMGLPERRSKAYNNLQYHPLIELVQDHAMDSLNTTLEEYDKAADDLIAPPTGERSVDARLPAALEKVRAATTQPNVLMITLESVGSRQLLGSDGRPRAEETPNIAGLAQHAAIFQSLYTVFPATARNHVALNTGGVHITGGSVFELCAYPFTGETVASAFGGRGYRTALFSSERLDGDAMDRLVSRFKYQTVWEFNTDRTNWTSTNVLNSWGAKEEFTIGKIEKWIDESRIAGKPFFVNFMNVSTHHPYSVPQGYPVLHQGQDDVTRYRNALNYTDHAIGDLAAFLRERSLLDNTIVVITGDHGEAFGDLHAHNFTHRERIFEENVKSFLIVSHPAIAGPIVSGRLAYSGDLFPTVCAATGLAAPDVPGKSLWAVQFEPRIVFFHKGAYPEQWGLRDGRWKFIATIRDHVFELYDLATDPTEQVNLASKDPTRARGYNAACRRWFIETDHLFASKLQGYHSHGDSDLMPEDYSKSGPKMMSVGYLTNAPAQRFVEQKTVSPLVRPMLWTKWVPSSSKRMVVFQWLSPSGKRYAFPSEVQAELLTICSTYPGPAPMENGLWHVTVADKDGERPLLTTQFVVSDKVEAPKMVAASP